MIEQSIPVIYLILGVRSDARAVQISETKVEFTKDDAVLAASRLLAPYIDDLEFYVMIADYNCASVSMYVNDYGSK